MSTSFITGTKGIREDRKRHRGSIAFSPWQLLCHFLVVMVDYSTSIDHSANSLGLCDAWQLPGRSEKWQGLDMHFACLFCLWVQHDHSRVHHRDLSHQEWKSCDQRNWHWPVHRGLSTICHDFVFCLWSYLVVKRLRNRYPGLRKLASADLCWSSLNSAFDARCQLGIRPTWCCRSAHGETFCLWQQVLKVQRPDPRSYCYSFCSKCWLEAFGYLTWFLTTSLLP